MTPLDASVVAGVREQYASFAEAARYRSAIYARWARTISESDELAALIARISPQHRQPPLVFAVLRREGLSVSEADVGSFLVRHSARVVAQCEARFVQTNDPGRCAALLPALTRVSGPIALIELGAAAGLCLYPDRYDYRLISGTETEDYRPSGVPAGLRLDVDVVGPHPPLVMPEIALRIGIDRHPRDARLDDDREWMLDLIWPEERTRRAAVRDALSIAAADPPTLIRADIAEPGVLDRVVEDVPDGLRIVVSTPGVLPYLDRASRTALRRNLDRLPVTWITLDRFHPSSWAGGRPRAVSPEAHAVGLDGRIVGYADALGRWVQWAGDSESLRPD